MLPLLNDEEHGKYSLLAFSALCNIIVIGHYVIETFYFRSMRMEVISIQGFILVINLYWSIVDYNQRRKVKVLMGREPEEADMDRSLRKKLREMGAQPNDKLRKVKPGEA
jgi:type VI protein secretion system component VasK